jgi:hypothetical protein
VRREITLAALIAIAAANGCKENRWVPRGRAEITLSEIKLQGAADVSRRIDADEGFAKSVLDGVASGDSVWLDVASQLRPPSAAAQASLAIALASALPRAPRKVLTMVDHADDKYPTEQVCGMPFLKADSSAVVTYYSDAMRAVSSVTDSVLATVVDVCRTSLDSSRSRRLQRIDPSYIIKNKPAPAPKRSRR